MQRRTKKRIRRFGRLIFSSLVSAIIFVLVLSIWFNPSSAKEGYEDVKSFITEKFSQVGLSSNNFISACKRDYQKYAEIGKKKHGFNYELIETEEVSTYEEGDEFIELYGDSILDKREYKNYLKSLELDPVGLISADRTERKNIVLIAFSVSVDMTITEQFSYTESGILFCEDGELTTKSKNTLTG